MKEYVVSPARQFDLLSPLRILAGVGLCLVILAAGFFVSGRVSALIDDSSLSGAISLLIFAPFLAGMLRVLFFLHARSLKNKDERTARYTLSGETLVISEGQSQTELKNSNVEMLGRRFWKNRFEARVGGVRVTLPSQVDLEGAEAEAYPCTYGLAIEGGKLVLKSWMQLPKGPLVERVLPF